MFSDSQEMDVGDAIAEQVQREFLVIDDPDYTGYVQRVGQKLLDHAPLTELRVQFFLSDLAVANALSLPGSRVYVSRKLQRRRKRGNSQQSRFLAALAQN